MKFGARQPNPSETHPLMKPRFLFGRKRRRPALSIVVAVYHMQRQAENTALSLTPEYQVGVAAEDYEVIIVENRSSSNMSSDFLSQLPSNFHYFLRDETEPTPVHAINEGVKHARGSCVCIMIDGARLLTPGVVSNLIAAHRLAPKVVATIPSYHLGKELQQDAAESGYNADTERALLASVGWPDNPYRLFEISCLSKSCWRGVFLENWESNCISMPTGLWRTLGGANPAFNISGGGYVNLDIYKRACEADGVTHVVIPGEGSFHQFHGGATTGGVRKEQRAMLMEEIRANYESIRGEPYTPPKTRPVVLGKIPDEAFAVLKHSVDMKMADLESSADRGQ